MTVVLDASMAVSFVLADEFDAQSKLALGVVASEGAVVPPLWDYEVLNALHSAHSRGRLSDADLTNAINGLSRLAIERDQRPIDGLRLTSIADDFGLSVYDAAYLSLTLDKNARLATRDSRLATSARKAGASVLK